ncbi:unnamed protein product, partial [Ectocarpus sp. 12 AP-2014]
GSGSLTSCTYDDTGLGDGLCSSVTNTEECGYDGGDCCECTCQAVEDDDYKCGPTYQCLDPTASCYGDEGSNPYPSCEDIVLVGNGYCDLDSNIEECGYDGGDCCECTCEDEWAICGPNYACIDPDASCFGDEGSNPFPLCDQSVGLLGDGYCSLDANKEDCGYDGGDCCECTCVTAEWTCGEDSDFICQDPDAECFVEGSSTSVSS